MYAVLSVRVVPRGGVVLRSGLATMEIMTVLVAAHTWAGGQLPTVGATAIPAALVFAAGTVVLRGRAPLWAVVPALTATQFLLHSWIVVLAPAPPGAHGHGSHVELTWQMVLAHLVAGLATALVWELRRRAVDVVLTWAEAGIVPVPKLRHSLTARPRVMPLRRPLVAVPLRGPPVAASAA